MAETIKNRVLQALGEDTAYLDDVPHPGQLFEDGLWEMATTLPERMLTMYATGVVDPIYIGLETDSTTEYNDTEDSTVTLALPTKILKVLRTEKIAEAEQLSSYIKRECVEKTYAEAIKGMDSNSIHFATKNTPIYWLQNSNGAQVLRVFPEAVGTSDEQYLPLNTAAIEVFKYTKESIAADWGTIESFEGIPTSAEEVIVLRIALKVLEHKIANAATQDEDSEIFTILSGAKDTITKSIQSLLSQLKTEWEDKPLAGLEQ
jgi:hypothetical protein